MPTDPMALLLLSIAAMLAATAGLSAIDHALMRRRHAAQSEYSRLGKPRLETFGEHILGLVVLAGLGVFVVWLLQSLVFLPLLDPPAALRDSLEYTLAPLPALAGLAVAVYFLSTDALRRTVMVLPLGLILANLAVATDRDRQAHLYWAHLSELGAMQDAYSNNIFAGGGPGNSNHMWELDQFDTAFSATSLDPKARDLREEFTWHGVDAPANQGRTERLIAFFALSPTGDHVQDARDLLTIHNIGMLRGTDWTRDANLFGRPVSPEIWANLRKSRRSDVEAFLILFPEAPEAEAARAVLADLTAQEQAAAWREVAAADVATLLAWIDRNQNSPFRADAEARIADLRADIGLWETAQRSADPSALPDFLARYPGHSMEEDAKNALQPIDIRSLLELREVSASGFGCGMEAVCLSLVNETDRLLRVAVPVGFVLVAQSANVQPMATVEPRTVVLRPDRSAEVRIAGACADITLDVPEATDVMTLILDRAVDPRLEQAASALARASNWDVQQTIVWLIRNDPSRRKLQDTLQRSYGAMPMGSAISTEEIEEALRLLDGAGFEPRNFRAWQEG